MLVLALVLIMATPLTAKPVSHTPEAVGAA